MKFRRLIARFIVFSFALALLLVVAFRVWPVSFFHAIMYWQEHEAGASSFYRNVDGHRVHYLEEGPQSGRPLLLIHGLTGSTEDWRNLAPSFSKAGFHVYMLDLLGFGRTDQPADFSYSVHDQAEFVVHFMDAVGLRNADIAGWSMGGGIAQHIAFRHPDRVRRLILLDSVGIYELPNWDTGLFTPETPAQLEAINRLLQPGLPPVPAFIAHDMIRRSRKNAWVTHRALNSLFTGDDATDKILPQLKLPVLIVWGDQDVMTPYHQADAMQRLLPNSERITAKGCGHLAPVLCTDRIAPGMVAFLQK